MALTEAEFVARYGGIYEHSAWVAEEAAPITAATEDINIIAQVMADCVDNASTGRQLALIRAHPDLAGKAQIAGELTEDSTSEQASAGLDQCSPEEYERFQALNREYHQKFGFPFVMAVRDSGRGDILAAFENRMENDQSTEFETALAEIHKIARLRFNAMEAG
ncbi:MAG: 2-oxo-4-hydroxy-4-carboxy-5-ureidoimidazoline decarboxylase [Gammaproteobacteria bacterium]|jgi:OHCU decarboxylase|nr:2-oxo-4-hydroxy-4-carboxy-5-ureidoimidazoline decarboxylase [Gammaproteobacteria bacterium]MDH3749982.1 2-oxo-4-hydroxy-4-carboxy-5-ureidoimidazoline decarboxylase [Gammaproteobacteria bacterium]MDH3806039.1 2-oxo-4-hydroxy-4-carboxy-5-ureidoimidazoline decarboxylase [Gammaproteobacteria bacterium]